MASATNPASGTASRDSSSGARRSRRVQSHGLWIGVAIVAVAVVVTAFFLTDGFRTASGSRTEILLGPDSYYSLPASQFAAVAFETHGSAKVTGTFLCTGGITVYSMTPSQVLYLSEKGQVNGYLWTSGRVANGTIDHLELNFTAGSWDVVFLNADKPIIVNPALNATIVSFFTGLTLSPT